MTDVHTFPAHEQAGYRFPEWQTVVDEARQSRYHLAAGIDPSIFSGGVDVSVLANDCLKGARSADALGNPRLHYGVRVSQRAALPLGSALTVRSEVTSIEPLRRGRLIRITFGFALADGSAPVTIEHQSLILDPEPVGTEPAPAVDRDWTAAGSIRNVTMSLAAVSGYSWEFPYLEGHHTQAGADRIGMRVPIAQGLHGFTLLMGEIARDLGGAPDACDIEAEFRRPIFCDDTVRLIGRRVSDGHWRELAVLNPAGKPTTQVLVREATR